MLYLGIFTIVSLVWVLISKLIWNRQITLLEMKWKHGKTWACHSEPTKPCLGAINFFKEKGLIAKLTDNELLTEDSDWHLYCTKY